MDVQLIIATLVAFVVIPLHLRNSRKLQNHIKNEYPNEWERVSANKMKMNIKNIRPIALNDSLKYGFLSQQNDEMLTKFLQFEKVSNVVWFLLIALLFISAWLQ